MAAEDPKLARAETGDRDLAREARERWQELKAERSHHEGDWEEIARLIRPQRGGFVSGDPKRAREEKPLSSAPIIAQANLASGLYGTLTNPANRWMALRTSDPDLNDFDAVRRWLDVVSARVLASFLPSVSGFYSGAIQLFSDIVAFGNAAQYDELRPAERRIMDMTLSLSEVVWDVDPWGRVNEVVRRFRLKPRQAAQQFDALPQRLADLAEKGDNGDVWFLHHVRPNDRFVKGRLGARGKAWLSVYVAETEEATLRVSGYDEMPFDVARWEVESGATCGTGPGLVALASARVVQRMEDATIKAAQFAADPVKLAPDRDAWPINGLVRPGQTIYGGVSPSGQQLVRTLDTHAGIGLTIEEKQAKIAEIRDAFNWSLMNLAGRTGMTATEVMTIQEERQRLMAPHQGRVQHEYLAPKVSRRFAMLWRAGQLPPPPKEVEGAALEVDYLSAAALAQRSLEGNAVSRVVQDLGPLAQVKPRVLDRLNEDEIMEALQAARGAPAAILRSREEADAMAKARAEQQARMAQMQQLQAAGGIARDMAGAAAQAGMVPEQGGAAA